MAFYRDLDCTDITPVPEGGNPFYRIRSSYGFDVGRNIVFLTSCNKESIRISIPDASISLVWIIKNRCYHFTIYGEFVGFIGPNLPTSNYHDTVIECYVDEESNITILDTVFVSGKNVISKSYSDRVSCIPFLADELDGYVNMRLAKELKEGDKNTEYVYLPTASDSQSFVILTPPIKKVQCKVVKIGMDTYTIDENLLAVPTIFESMKLKEHFKGMVNGDFRILTCIYNYALGRWCLAPGQ